MEKHQERSINKQLLRCWAVVVAVLLAAYLWAVAKGVLDIPYLLCFTAILVVPLIIACVIYRQDPGTRALKYVIMGAYLVMYGFVLFTSHTHLVFAYVFPVISLLILFHNEKLILWMGLISFVMNVSFILREVQTGMVDIRTSMDPEIQLAVLIMVFAFCFLAARLYGRIHAENLDYMEKLNEKSKELESMTMQTITAIAGTIDAKDSYTEGHSLRVAEYSRALARALGKNETESDRIYHIALLHDIGKIGVPDSVLHKPGRLTPEEYALIKQHPTIGARILKDVKAFPGLEIGALYHHERYDGRGYPEGLAGENIPEVARIICVADTLDAMNTNRVYRKRFSKEHIIEELQRCSGTQFDPHMADTMIELIRNGTVDEIEAHTASLERRLEPADESDDGVSLARLSGLLISRLADEHSEKYLLESLADRETFNMVEQDIISSLEECDGCLVLVDVDDMGAVNKAVGLLRGDYILAQIANVLITADHQMPVCRLEGDEFLCYINDVESTDEAKKLIGELRHRIYQRLSETKDISVTFSIGAACSTATGRKFSSLLYGAEKALNTSKRGGTNGFTMYTQWAMSLTAANEDAQEKDLDNISAVIEHRESYSGAMKVDFEDFGQVYELLRNIGIRNAQTLQLVLFTVEFGNDADIHISERSQVMQYLDKAIVNSVRKVDVTTRYSSTQQLALFSNLPTENLHIVTERIIREFYCMVSESKFQLTYSYRTISLEKQ